MQPSIAASLSSKSITPPVKRSLISSLYAANSTASPLIKNKAQLADGGNQPAMLKNNLTLF